VRLDLAVAQTFGLSRRAAREAVRSGRVDVDGAAVDEPGRDVPEGARLAFDPARPQRRRVRSRLPVLHEDADVLIVDKPAGLLTVPTEDREKDTAWSRALQYLQRRYGGRPHAGIVHRLDKDTSGALAFARNREALHVLQDLFRTHAIEREYVALVLGAPPDRGTFDADLVREAGLRRRTVRAAGERGVAGRADGTRGRPASRRAVVRRAVTRFRTLERFPDAALVAVRPETGRTHQIRVHFAEAGYPILGDRVYGSASGAAERAPRQMLHARTLGFRHPGTGRAVSAEAPLPEDFERALAALRAAQKKRPGEAGPRENRRDGKGSATRGR
jgi:23S rRNA pseudouridine1911/1915/1917 synthase